MKLRNLSTSKMDLNWVFHLGISHRPPNRAISGRVRLSKEGGSLHTFRAQNSSDSWLSKYSRPRKEGERLRGIHDGS